MRYAEIHPNLAAFIVGGLHPCAEEPEIFDP